ncbi:hypothetical protein WH5701_16268 [Synechococcus sp. WH 5701]|nr:hypothetical protein WH5701_16268 [Synechococcus sp. WH 5701]
MLYQLSYIGNEINLSFQLYFFLLTCLISRAESLVLTPP